MTRANELRKQRMRDCRPAALARIAALSIAVLLVAGAASATELLEARVTAGAVPELQNGGGTLRLEQPQVNATEPRTFYVPEPGALWQLGSGLGGLALLCARRRRRAASRSSSAVAR